MIYVYQLCKYRDYFCFYQHTSALWVNSMRSVFHSWNVGFLTDRHAVCIFYLVLRALDTVEDDMTIPLEQKVPLLHDFHTFLYQPDWCFTQSREKDRRVLEDFPTVRWCLLSTLHDFTLTHSQDLNVFHVFLQISVEFRSLGQEYRDVISDICHRMGVGMAEFLEKKVGSMKEWDRVNV